MTFKFNRTESSDSSNSPVDSGNLQDIGMKKPPCECLLYNASDPSYKVRT